MAISFEDSLHTARNGLNTSVMMPISEPYAADGVFASNAWTQDAKYDYYEEYSDDAISNIDSNKNIILDPTQVNLTQEVNSQYIPFEMPRYYDGFDLQTTNILIHFVNRDMYEDYDSPINVFYNDEKIKFGWLIDERVTAVDGVVRFEIQAVGTNSAGEEYIWKTKPSDGLNILKSLTGGGVIEPDTSWLTSFMSQVEAQVALAKQYADEAKAAAESGGSGGSGGTVAITLDKTLTVEGQAADAKAVGDAIAAMSDIELDDTLSVSGKAADAKAVGDAIAAKPHITIDTTLSTSGKAADAKVVGDKFAVVGPENWSRLSTMAETLVELTRETMSGTVVRDGQEITITEILEDGSTFVIVMELDETDCPTNIIVNGREIPWTWSGF